MANLKYDATECGYECGECGARLGANEIARFWNFEVTEDKFQGEFQGGYCMDCGTKFEEVV